MIGFFEEAADVRSMTRLVMFVLTMLAAVVVATICAYVFVVAHPNAAVIGALVGALGALVVNGVVAIIHRNGGDGTDTQ